MQKLVAKVVAKTTSYQNGIHRILGGKKETETMGHLTKTQVETSKYDGGKSGKSLCVHWDDSPRGLGLRIQPSGSRSWILKYRVKGKQKIIKLGDFPVLSLSQARREAMKVLVKITSGDDPSEEKRRLKERPNVKSLCIQYVTHHSKVHSRSWKEVERTFERELFPSRIAHKIAEELTVKDVQTFHHSMSDRPILANRVVERLRAAFNWSKKRGLIPRTTPNPCDDVDKFRERSRDTFCKPSDLSRLLKAIKEYNDPILRGFFQFLIYTGLRKGEALRLKWSDIDLEDKSLRIEETKSGATHYLPLNPLALEVLESLPRYYENDHVFPSSWSKSGHITEPKKAWDTIRMKAEMPDLRIHDLRRTHGSLLAIFGVPLQVIGKTLNHKSLQATQIYSRLSDDPVRAAQAVFAEKLKELDDTV